MLVNVDTYISVEDLVSRARALSRLRIGHDRQSSTDAAGAGAPVTLPVCVAAINSESLRGYRAFYFTTTCVRANTQTHRHTYTHIPIHTDTRTHTHTHVHTNTHNTQTHTQIQRPSRRRRRRTIRAQYAYPTTTDIPCETRAPHTTHDDGFRKKQRPGGHVERSTPQATA